MFSKCNKGWLEVRGVSALIFLFMHELTPDAPRPYVSKAISALRTKFLMRLVTPFQTEVCSTPGLRQFTTGRFYHFLLLFTRFWLHYANAVAHAFKNNTKLARLVHLTAKQSRPRLYVNLNKIDGCLSINIKFSKLLCGDEIALQSVSAFSFDTS